MAKIRKCKWSNCYSVAVDGTNYCINHQDRQQADNIKEYNRLQTLPKCTLYQTYQWKKLKHDMILANPYCSNCGSQIGLEPHHTIKHNCNPDIFFNTSNIILLCSKCHDATKGRR